MPSLAPCILAFRCRAYGGERALPPYCDEEEPKKNNARRVKILKVFGFLGCGDDASDTICSQTWKNWRLRNCSEWKYLVWTNMGLDHITLCPCMCVCVCVTAGSFSCSDWTDVVPHFRVSLSSGVVPMSCIIHPICLFSITASHARCQFISRRLNKEDRLTQFDSLVTFRLR